MRITAKVQPFHRFPDKMGKSLQNCSYFELFVGLRLPSGKNYCTIAGIWLMPRLIEANGCIYAVISLDADNSPLLASWLPFSAKQRNHSP
jgi:hypothetical protein